MRRNQVAGLMCQQPLRSEIEVTSIASFDFDGMGEGEQAEFWIPGRRMAQMVANPLLVPPWEGMPRPIRRSDVYVALNEGAVVEEHVGAFRARNIDPDELYWLHVGRIARFVMSMPSDAVTLDVGIPGLDAISIHDVCLLDGHHRLAASIIRGDDILTTFAGSFDRFRELFPEAVGFARWVGIEEPFGMAANF